MSGGGGFKLNAVGRTDGATIAAGLVGESITAISIPSSSPIALTSGVDALMAGFDMPNGEFFVVQRLSLICSPGVLFEQIAMDYGALASVNTNGGRGAVYPFGATVNDTSANRRPTFRNVSFSNLADVTAMNFMARAIFSGGTVSAYGAITLKRLAAA